LAVNPLDEEALRRVINYPARGIGETTMQKITLLAGQGNLPIWEIIANHSHYQLGIAGKTATAISNFITMILAFGTQVQTRSAFDLAEYIAKASGIMKEIDEDKTIEGQARMENIEALLNAVQEFVEREPGPGEETGEVRHLDLFMQEVSLLTDQDTGDKNDTDRVSLMTIHQAKGLEFPYVFIAGLEENLFPSFMSINSRADLEEERRLFYVAITRAEKRATISYAESRYKWGQLTLSEPSRFIDEIDERYVERPVRAKWNRLNEDVQPKNPKPGYTPKPVQPAKSPQPKPTQPPAGNFKKVGSYPKDAPAPQQTIAGNDDIEKIQPGMTVEHATFGKGKVTSVEGTGPNKKASVMFESVGLKQLLLRFAKLKF
jgi:DNA helicase-2/ATP-dependent DNA helicase PcrA